MKQLSPLKKGLLVVLGSVMLGVVGWYVGHVESVNATQWGKMTRIEERLNALHAN